jgi:uncharacterized protein (TIGR03437 family)
MYYMDQGRSNYLPWTNLRLYDWVKSKVAGFNFIPGASFSCCTTINGKTMMFGRVLDTLSLSFYRDFSGISGGIAVIAHEARHVDGFPHVGCCPAGPNACDQTYDEKNLSPYGIQSWLYRNWLSGNVNVGLFCSYSNEIRTISTNLIGGAQGYEMRFCDLKPPATPNYTIADAPGGSCSLRTLSLANNGITNAADYAIGILPGGIQTLFGTGIGSSTSVTSPHITPQNTVDTSLGGTEVLFNGVPGPMLYTTANQVSAIAPFGAGSGDVFMNGQNYAYVEVQTNGKLSNIVQEPVILNAVPGIFSIDGSGTGPAAALNQDGSVNTVSNPAARGSVVQFFATGFGNTTPAETDGEIVPVASPFPTLPNGIGVTIGGLSAKIQYQGAAPGAVAGLAQINVFVPAGVTPGSAVPVKMTFVGTSNTVTIAVQ